jgi:hypothetical protein
MLLKICSDVIIFRCICKANCWGEDTAYCPCHTISQQPPCHVCPLVTAEARVRKRIAPFGIRETKMSAIYMVFSWYFPFPCQYPNTKTTYSHYNHRPHHTISQFSCQYPYTNDTYSHYKHRPHHTISQFPSQYPYTNATYSHHNHRPHQTISQFYTVFN